MTGNRWNPAARYGVAGMLAGLAMAWILGNGRVPPAHAQATPPDAGGTIALTAAGVGSTQWLYLIDTRNQAFAVYRIDPQDTNGAVKLEGTRQYRWDMLLSEYNNNEPNVLAVQSMVGSVRR